MIIVDTSLLVSFLNPGDLHHKRAATWFESMLETELVSPSLALVELAATFARAGYSESSTQKLIGRAKSPVNFESTDDCIGDAVFAAKTIASWQPWTTNKNQGVKFWSR
jgi:predicted nucleic acid-binding protein